MANLPGGPGFPGMWIVVVSRGRSKQKSPWISPRLDSEKRRLVSVSQNAASKSSILILFVKMFRIFD
jgi:hypothetical protein